MKTPEAILLAAKRWLVELDRRTLPQARTTFSTAASFRDLTPTQYELAFSWLVQHGLLSPKGFRTDKVTLPEIQIVRVAIRQSEPVWLADADKLVPDASELPLDVLGLGTCLQVSESDLHDEVVRAWRVYDNSVQAALGEAGERAMLEWLRTNLPSDLEIVQFAGIDDSVGFDFAVAQDGKFAARIEVKATRRPNSVVFYLSRNEFHVMRTRPDWCLQIVQLDSRNSIVQMYWLSRNQIEAWSPKDGKMAIWQSMRFDLPVNTFQTGPAPEIRSLRVR